MSKAICFNIFAKPKHTSLFILERRGASGKDQLKALLLPPLDLGQVFTDADLLSEQHPPKSAAGNEFLQ